MATGNNKLYPNFDISVWTRSCEKEVNTPIEGKITGEIPTWLRGSVLRNGPGATKVGAMNFDHLLDSAALLHRFCIYDGKATYQCRFLKSETYKKNLVAQRIVVTEFGTKAVPDPCHTIFRKVASLFRPSEIMTDNALVSLYPFGDEIYAMTEVPIIHRVDPVTLETMEKKNPFGSALVCHTAHPHVMSNGDVYNMGQSIVKGRIQYILIKFPYSEKGIELERESRMFLNKALGDMFEQAHIVGAVPPRWTFNPAYMHSFGMTDKYFVIVEQPMAVSFYEILNCYFKDDPWFSALKWYPEEETHIILVNRETGEEEKRYRTDNLFYMHIINTYEQDGMLVVDLCTYKDAKMLDAMYMESLKNMQSNPSYAEWFRSRPKRIEMRLDAPNLTKVEPRLLAVLGCELPQINYRLCNGKPYRYFYAISSDIDTENPGALIKVDTESGVTKTWSAPECYASEPVFVPTPDGVEEDDGVILSALLRSGHEQVVLLVVLDARTMHEVARAEFQTPSPAVRCLHGLFLPA